MTQLLSGTRFLLRYRICAAHDPCMQAGAATLRNRVFVQEQRVFTDHDRDAIDEHALPLVAIGEDAAGGGHREGTARARSARELHAHVQTQNVVLFRRMHGTVRAEVDLHGRPHAHMLADLSHYTAIDDPARGWQISAPGPSEVRR